MKSLKTFQDGFQQAILSGDTQHILPLIPDSDKETRETLFRVYQNAYVVRLMEFLAADYEKLHAYLGDEQFHDLATDYIRQFPSEDPNARWFSTRLPEFLNSYAPMENHPELIELALLERALTDMFDAAQMPTLTLEHLASVAPEEWGPLVFDPQPATRLLTFSTNAVDIWSALKEEQAPPAPQSNSQPLYILCFRHDRMSKFRCLDAEEGILWHELTKKTPFAGLCEIAATYAGEDDAPLRVATYLQDWITTGLLALSDEKIRNNASA